MKAFLGTAGSILRARIAPTVASPLVSCTSNGSSARGEMLVSRRGRAFSRSRGAAKAQEMCAVQGQPVLVQFRSEERRVGKESRSRGWLCGQCNTGVLKR